MSFHFPKSWYREQDTGNKRDFMRKLMVTNRRTKKSIKNYVKRKVYTHLNMKNNEL